jgi:hypothetical protein
VGALLCASLAGPLLLGCLTVGGGPAGRGRWSGAPRLLKGAEFHRGAPCGMMWPFMLSWAPVGLSV